MSRGPAPLPVRPLALATTIALLLGACGDPEDGDPTQAGRCGDPGSWSLVRATDTDRGGVLGLVGGRVAAWTQADGGIPRVHGADPCGEDSVTVSLEAELEGGDPIAVGDHLLVLADDAAHRIDLATGDRHAAFAAVFPQMQVTPGGVLALGIGGKLYLHPDPADPEVEPTLLLDGVAFLPRPDQSDPPKWPHLWTDGAQTFALTPTFELMRVDLGGAAPQVELTEVQEFHVLDGGRKVAWRGLTGEMLRITNLADDAELLAQDQRDTHWNVDEAGRWALVTTDRGRLLNLDSGSIIEPVDFDPVEILPTSTDSVLLVGHPNGSIDRGYWLLSADGMLSSFLPADACLEFDSKPLLDGIVIPDGPCDPQTALYNPVDEMVLVPFAGGARRTLSQRFGFSYSVLDGDGILSWTEVVGTGLGALASDFPGSDPLDMADDVTSTPPVVDGLDVYYVQADRGVQRFTLAGD